MPRPSKTPKRAVMDASASRASQAAKSPAGVTEAPANLLTSYERLEEQRQREWLFRRHRRSRAGWNRE